VLVPACVQCNPTTSLAAVQHALINYLKMAPYRQGGADKMQHWTLTVMSNWIVMTSLIF